MPGLEVIAMMTKLTKKRTIKVVVMTEFTSQVRKDILEAAKAMVVTRERQEEEAGAEVGFNIFHFHNSTFTFTILFPLSNSTVHFHFCLLDV